MISGLSPDLRGRGLLFSAPAPGAAASVKAQDVKNRKGKLHKNSQQETQAKNRSKRYKKTTAQDTKKQQRRKKQMRKIQKNNSTRKNRRERKQNS